MDVFDLGNLECNGFAVVKNFLDATDIKEITTNYQLSQARPRTNKNYNIIPSVVQHHLDHQIQHVLQRVAHSTSVVVNWSDPHGVFFDTEEIKFDWHQDHEPYWWSQDSFNHLNFWMPIIKCDIDNAGLNLVPFENLAPLDREKIIRSGARRFVTNNMSTLVQDDSTGSNFVIDLDLATVAVTPQIEVGDVIIMRGDVIHQTQPTLQHRVAFSVRCYQKQSILLREKFIKGGRFKRNMIQQNTAAYAFLIDQFVQQGRDTVPFTELIEHNWSLHG
jgi:ectoine hydroxylase-related dioxygenase (phytanoyl-CoA dioxygenase family)